MKKSRKNRRVLGFREKDGETIPITAKVRHHIRKIVASAKGLNISPKIKQFYGSPSGKVGRRKLTKFDKEAEEAYAKLGKPVIECGWADGKKAVYYYFPDIDKNEKEYVCRAHKKTAEDHGYVVYPISELFAADLQHACRKTS